MKSIKTILIALVCVFLFISCSTSSTSNEESADESTSDSETCKYSYNADSTSLKWTAYKFSAKTGVAGTFDKIEVTNTQVSENIMEVLVGAEFTIITGSVNSGNVERDPKLVEFFFNKLANTEAIKGKINSINNGEAVVSILLNDKSVDVVGKVTQEGDKVSMTLSIDMNNFDGMGAVNSLNEACSALHTDKDGESKLWPNVDIVVSTILNKQCK